MRNRIIIESVINSYALLDVLEDSDQVGVNDIRRLGSVDDSVEALLGVVLSERRGLLVICVEAFLERIDVVVGAALERLACHVVDHGHFGRVELFVVGTTARFVDETSCDTSDEEIVFDLELNYCVEFLVSML